MRTFALILLALAGGCLADDIYVGDVPACEEPSLGAGRVAVDRGERLARLSGNRTVVAGCTALRVLASDYSVEREVAIETSFPVSVVAGPGDEVYVLDIEWLPYRGDPEGDEGPTAEYWLLALDAQGAERWRADLGWSDDTDLELQPVQGGVAVRGGFWGTLRAAYSHDGVQSDSLAHRGVMDELGGFISVGAESRGATDFVHSIDLKATSLDGAARWSKTLTATANSTGEYDVLRISSVFGLPMGDTVIAGGFNGSSLEFGDLSLAQQGGSVPGFPHSDFVARIDPLGATKWATVVDPEDTLTLIALNVVLAEDRVILGSENVLAEVGPTGITAMTSSAVGEVKYLYPSVAGHVAALEGWDPTSLTDLQLP